MSAEIDREGRLSPKALREKYGEKYHAVTYDDRIELAPVADDPLGAVREAAGDSVMLRSTKFPMTSKRLPVTRHAARTPDR